MVLVMTKKKEKKKEKKMSPDYCGSVGRVSSANQKVPMPGLQAGSHLRACEGPPTDVSLPLFSSV